MSMSMPRPAPVPRKRAVSGPSLSQNSTSSSDLQVTGLRSTLDEMSMPELRAVLDDVASLHELIMNLNVPRLKELLEKKQSTSTENKKLATDNLEHKPKLENLQNELLTAQSEVKNLLDTYKQYYNELTELAKKMDNEKIFTDLQKSVSDLENQTEEIGEAFLSSKMNEEQFLDQYLQSRASYWLRKVKVEKMDELLHQTAPKIPPRRSAPPKIPAPYRSTTRGNMPTASPRANTIPGDNNPQPAPVQQPPYQPQSPVAATTQGAPYTHPPQYQQPAPPRPSYQPPPGSYPPSARPVYQPPSTRPAYQPPSTRPAYQPPSTRPAYQPPSTRSAYQPPVSYPQQTGYRPPGYPQQPGYPPQPGYRPPPQPSYQPGYRPQPAAGYRPPGYPQQPARPPYQPYYGGGYR
ncbi:vacuolar protein sorting-associated protein 37B-like [Dysidea avara]|uniref:vacuolar protein sorting-associated protein 37B-like n=1 Tax=Dysidea avara TaxID=196820 RepID=UPI003320273C